MRDDPPVVEPDDATERGDARATDGFAHLQAAARELIAAARAVLDVAEELVDDPGTVNVVADAVGTAVRTAASFGRRAAGADGVASADGGRDGSGTAGAGGVQRIRVQ